MTLSQRTQKKKRRHISDEDSCDAESEPTQKKKSRQISDEDSGDDEFEPTQKKKRRQISVRWSEVTLII